MTAFELLAACLLDAALGDPRRLPHPVRVMGYAIVRYERMARSMVRRPVMLKFAGVVLAVGLPGLVYGVIWTILEITARIHATAHTLAVVGLSFTALAGRDLVDHALAVRQALKAGSLNDARKAVSNIVGRDTDRLPAPEVIRATVETIAESTADGVVSPLFYLMLGGPALALAFKAVSTLDSMIGHLDSRYRDIGWASARLDDAANWLPARVTGLLIVLAAAFTTQRMQAAWHILKRDAAKHPSPNSGRPEAAMAGALGVQLGGTNWYGARPTERPLLGDKENELAPHHIEAALRTMVVVSSMAVGMGIVVLMVMR